METTVNNPIETTKETERKTTKDDDDRKDENKKKAKGVAFGEVRIREHERVLNRRVSGLYAALTLGWAHKSSKHQLVDEYEKKRDEKKHDDDNRGYRDFERLQVLTKYGYSTKEILKLEEEKKKRLRLLEKGIKQREEAMVPSSSKGGGAGAKGLFAKFSWKRKR